MTDFPRTKTSWSELKVWNDANFESTEDLEHFKISIIVKLQHLFVVDKFSLTPPIEQSEFCILLVYTTAYGKGTSVEMPGKSPEMSDHFS